MGVILDVALVASASLKFYADPKSKIETKKDAEQWQETLDSLRALRATEPAPAGAE